MSPGVPDDFLPSEDSLYEPPPPVEVEGEAGRLKQVLVRLLYPAGRRRWRSTDETVALEHPQEDARSRQSTSPRAVLLTDDREQVKDLVSLESALYRLLLANVVR
jgi:hypothetical protein